MLVYVAGAIDLNDRGHDLKEDLARRISDMGYTAYCPWRAFSHTDGNGRYVRAANLKMIENSNALIAAIDPGIYSHGTVVDIEYAYESGVPVFVVLLGDADPPMYLEHMPCFSCLEDALSSMDKTLCNKAAFSRILYLMRKASVGLRSASRPDIVSALTEAGDGPPAVSETYVDSRPILCTTTGDHPSPTKAYHDDAGFDLYVRGVHSIPSGGWADVEVGTKLALPSGYWGLILGRSSAFYRLGLQIQPAVIDAGWRGGLEIAVFNGTDKDICVEDKDRIAQFVPLPAPRFHIESTEELPPGSRGERGFGSSGR